MNIQNKKIAGVTVVAVLLQYEYTEQQGDRFVIARVAVVIANREYFAQEHLEKPPCKRFCISTNQESEEFYVCLPLKAKINCTST